MKILISRARTATLLLAMALPFAGTMAASTNGDAVAAVAESERQGLSAELVYSVLVGEIAVQRGDHRTALEHYSDAARLSQEPVLAELAARAALSAGDSDAAIAAARLWVDIAPESLKARQIAAYAQIDAGDTDAALAELRELVKRAPSRGLGYMQAAQLMARVTDADKRLQLMQALVGEDSDDADGQYALATLAAAAERNEQAQVYAERAAELRPGWNKPRLFLIRLLVAADRRDDALAVLDEFLASEPDDQELQMLRAQFHIEAEEYSEALAIFDAILDAGPGQSDVLFAAAVLALEVEALDQARDYLTTLRETGQRGSDTAFMLGQVEEAAGNPQEAMRWYGEVRGENATNARVRIAGIHADSGDVARAREILQQLRDQFPSDVTTLYLIEAELLRERDMEQQAIDVYTTALDAKPDNPDLLYARAMLAIGMDRIDTLERDLRRILITDPDHVDALNALGYTLADRTERLDEAYSLIQRALQLSPDEPAILDSMGWVLYRMGKLDAAEPYLRRALDAVFDAEIAAHLGELLWAQGKRDEAREVWERALDEDPEHEYLLRVLGRHRFTHSER
ncbi:MAG: tetratricopeptide repeat protein [Thiohalocapsa sp.]|nr:tetratricopeptide repeat protein [Thiohalocapsa sp.]